MREYILVVEDEEDARESLSFLLELQGHEVKTAMHGKEALETIALHGPPCAVLLDLMMPVMNGWDFCEALRADEALRETPIIVLSGVADASAAARSLEAVAHLQKPCDLKKLYSVVEAHC